jgi:hypothetical protein
VVIGGDAGNDVLAPPRASSTSEQVEKLAKGVDIVVHSTMHPVMVMSGWLAVLSDFTSQNRGRGAASSRQIFFGAPIHRAPPFPNIDQGCSFHHVVQAKHPEASRTKQPLRSPAPRHQCKASRGNGRGGNDEKA